MRSGAARYAALVADVAACEACPGGERGVAYTRVLGGANGPLDASLLVVGEAPGRDGAARTGVPFHGDRSGDRFEALLAAAGLDRSRVFVTNAVLCDPRDAGGANRRPRLSEVTACSDHFRRTLEVVRAPVVAALGGVALDALGRLEPHGVGRLSESAGTPRAWAGRMLVPLVHPSPRTQGRRSWDRQLDDWRRLGDLVRGRARAEADAAPADRCSCPAYR